LSDAAQKIVMARRDRATQPARVHAPKDLHTHPAFPKSDIKSVVAIRTAIPMPKNYWVYIMASARNGTLYIGMTNDLVVRIGQHRDGIADGFTKKYGV